MEYLPTAQQLHSELHIDGSQLKKVNTFKYLGSHISANGHIDDEINNRPTVLMEGSA